MKKVTGPLLVGTVVIGAALVVMPFLLWGENPPGEHSGADAEKPKREIVVYSAASPEGLYFDGLSGALREMRDTIIVGSAVATTAVYEGNVIIAKNHEHWRTIPVGVVFLLASNGAEVFIDQAEFAIYLKKHPELARAGAQALKLDEFLPVLFSEEPL